MSAPPVPTSTIVVGRSERGDRPLRQPRPAGESVDPGQVAQVRHERRLGSSSGPSSSSSTPDRRSIRRSLAVAGTSSIGR